METGTYITDIALEKELQTSQQKFKQFSQLTFNVPRQSNFFRLTRKNFTEFLSEEYYECKKAKPGIYFYRVNCSRLRRSSKPKRESCQIPKSPP